MDKREVILTGFNAINHDHGLHSVTAGPDGKFYFNNGNCGACSVILDGRLVNSCLVFGFEVQGCDIQTIEGIGSPEDLHPLQQQFLEHAALQCGICTPGFIVAAKALLDRNPDPTEAEIRNWLAGNLCRCTGYDKIVRAVMDAAKVSQT